MSRRLLELATLAETTVTIDGESLRVVEPNGWQMMEYRRLRAGQKADPKTGQAEVKPDLVAAVAHLVEHCVVDAEGEPLYTAAESRTIAGGRSEVFLPLIVALTGFERPEKKKAT